MKVLFLGDVVAKSGRRMLEKYLLDLKEQYSVDFVIANAENSAGGLGITPTIMEELLAYGVDVLTSGNHIWKKKEIFSVLDEPHILRPANYPETVAGHGYAIFQRKGIKIAVINLLGRIFMDPVDNPFNIIDEILSKDIKADIKIVDLHAEATSEKIAMGWHLDGRVSALIGTHTHVQTADEIILPEGTAYISDAGMTGCCDGVIVVEKKEIINYFLNNTPFSYKACTGNSSLQGVYFEIDEKTGKAIEIKRIKVRDEV